MLQPSVTAINTAKVVAPGKTAAVVVTTPKIRNRLYTDYIFYRDYVLYTDDRSVYIQITYEI